LRAETVRYGAYAARYPHLFEEGVAHVAVA
jgi:hypothetical protein